MVIDEMVVFENVLYDIKRACKRKDIEVAYHYPMEVSEQATVTMFFTKNDIQLRRGHTFEYIAKLRNIHDFVESIVEEIDGAIEKRRLYISTAFNPDSWVKRQIDEAKKGMRDMTVNNLFFPRATTVPEIKKVIYNGPCTIVLWDDGTKTIVKCQRWDTFDKEKGLAMAICKKVMGNNKSHSNYNDIFKKWCKDDDVNKPIGIIRLD